jgi:hypothetical protein
MGNKFHIYDDLLDESGSYRAAAEKALIRSFYGNEKDLLRLFIFQILFLQGGDPFQKSTAV